MNEDDRKGTLVRISSGERDLDGAWFPPGSDPWTGLLHLHGKGGNFYSGPGRFLAEAPELSDFGHLALNMQCHDLGYTLGGTEHHPDPHEGHVEVAGGMWEEISRGHHDVTAGVQWLRRRGASKVFVSGHSSGGFYAAQAAAKGLSFDGTMLLSPVISHQRHMERWFPGRDLGEVKREAEHLVQQGEGHALIPVKTWYYAISAASLLERFEEPDEQLLRHLSRTSQPVLMVCGGLESRVDAWRHVLDRLDHLDSHMIVVKGADHSYRGGEDQVIEGVRAFISNR